MYYIPTYTEYILYTLHTHNICTHPHTQSTADSPHAACLTASAASHGVSLAASRLLISSPSSPVEASHDERGGISRIRRGASAMARGRWICSQRTDASQLGRGGSPQQDFANQPSPSSPPGPAPVRGSLFSGGSASDEAGRTRHNWMQSITDGFRTLRDNVRRPQQRLTGTRPETWLHMHSRPTRLLPEKHIVQLACSAESALGVGGRAGQPPPLDRPVAPRVAHAGRSDKMSHFRYHQLLSRPRKHGQRHDDKSPDRQRLGIRTALDTWVECVEGKPNQPRSTRATRTTKSKQKTNKNKTKTIPLSAHM